LTLHPASCVACPELALDKKKVDAAIADILSFLLIGAKETEAVAVSEATTLKKGNSYEQEFSAIRKSRMGHAHSKIPIK